MSRDPIGTVTSLTPCPVCRGRRWREWRYVCRTLEWEWLQLTHPEVFACIDWDRTTACVVSGQTFALSICDRCGLVVR